MKNFFLDPLFWLCFVGVLFVSGLCSVFIYPDSPAVGRFIAAFLIGIVGGKFYGVLSK